MFPVSNYLNSFTVVISSFKVVATEVSYTGVSLDVRSYIPLNIDFYVIALGQTTCSTSVISIFDFTEVKITCKGFSFKIFSLMHIRVIYFFPKV